MDILWQEDDIDIALKIVIVGDGGVGKSSLIRRFCQGVFTSTYKKTIGVDFLEKVVTADNGRQVRLMLWDTAGQEEFDAITRAYYRGSHFCLLAFSTTDRKSLDNVQYWKEKVERECGNIPMMLIMNKIDLVHTALVSRYEAEDVANMLDLEMFTTSAKDNVNIELVFQHLASSYFNSLAAQTAPARHYSPRVQVGGWRQKKSHCGRERARRLQQQLARQDLAVQQRLYKAARQGDIQPRSVQRRQSSLSRLNVNNSLRLESEPELEMWEDPLHVNNFPLMLSGASPKPSLVRLNNSLYLPVLQDDQEQWQSNLFSVASSPSLVPSSRSTSRSQLVSETDNDSATQFLNNPMFDSIKTKRSWGVKRRAKYSLNQASDTSGLSGRCSIM